MNKINLEPDERPAIGGWVPGSYWQTCTQCNKTFTGDKRASNCANCAYQYDEDNKDKLEFQHFNRFTNNLKEPVECMTYKEAYVMDYDTASELVKTQNDVFWTAEEISVEKDVHDVMVNMTDAERHGVTTVLKLFTKYEIKAGDDWWGQRIKTMFPRPCIMKMASCFSFFETNVHAPFYDKLNEALHINTEDFYLSYKKDKVLNERMEYINKIVASDDMMLSTAIFAMIEGVVLYSSFAFLKHFQAKDTCEGCSG